MLHYWAMLKDNLENIEERIYKAAARSKRNAKDISVIAVTKGVALDCIKEVCKLGIKDIAENRVQEANRKQLPVKALGIKMHMVGHLQTNKVKDAVSVFDFIHSLDSLELISLIERYSAMINKIINTFIQVNTSGETSKFGIKSDQVNVLVSKVIMSPHLNLLGFMTIAPFSRNQQTIRTCFSRLCEIRNKISGNINKKLYLSMGMSDDFEIAIEEGADFIRIGRAIFGGK